MQLTLPVELPEDVTLDNFVTSQDTLPIIDYLTKVVLGQERHAVPICLLKGPSGSGKSHLLFGVCQLAEKYNLHVAHLNLSDCESLDISLLDDMEHFDVVTIDNVDDIAGNKKWEVALFNFINRICSENYQGSRIQIIMSTSALPQHMPLTLPDLASRLSWGTTLSLNAPSDEIRDSVIRDRAKAKGLTLTDSARNFLLTHSDRHLSKLLEVLDQLDQASLREQRKITLPMVKSVLSET